MNALAMPISSRTADETLSACFCTKSPRILDDRSATSWHTFASSCASFLSVGCISHDAIIPQGTLCSAGIVQVMQVGDRFTHRKKCLVQIERPAEKHREQFAGALRRLQRSSQFGQPLFVMLFQL